MEEAPEEQTSRHVGLVEAAEPLARCSSVVEVEGGVRCSLEARVEDGVRYSLEAKVEDGVRCSLEVRVEEAGLSLAAELAWKKPAVTEVEWERSGQRHSSLEAMAVLAHGPAEAEEQQSAQEVEAGSMESWCLQMVVALRISQTEYGLHQVGFLVVAEEVEGQNSRRSRVPYFSRAKQELHSQTCQHLQAEEAL